MRVSHQCTFYISFISTMLEGSNVRESKMSTHRERNKKSQLKKKREKILLRRYLIHHHHRLLSTHLSSSSFPADARAAWHHRGECC